MGINQRLAISHIMDGLNIAGELAKRTTHNKSIMLVSRNTPQAASEKNENVIRKTYPYDKQYLAFQELANSKSTWTHSYGREQACEVGQ